MIPIAPVVSLVVILVRVWLWRQKSPGAPFPRSAAGVRRSDPRELNLAARFLFCLFATALLVGLHRHYATLSDLGFFLVVVVSLPALVLRSVLVPLGLARAAYWFAFLSPPRDHSAEIRGGAVLMGALALARSRRPSRETATWLEDKLGHQSTVRSLSIAAVGLLAAARGNEGAARAILRAVEGVTPQGPSPLAVREARTWLVAEAARRGDWSDVVAIGADSTAAPTFPWPYLMGIIARRLTHDPIAPTNSDLWKAWLRAPHRLGTLPLLRRALATVDAAPLAIPAADPLPSDPADLLATALQAHAACLEHPSQASLVVGRAWLGCRAHLSRRRVAARSTRSGSRSPHGRRSRAGAASLFRRSGSRAAPRARSPAGRTGAARA